MNKFLIDTLKLQSMAEPLLYVGAKRSQTFNVSKLLKIFVINGIMIVIENCLFDLAGN